MSAPSAASETKAHQNTNKGGYNTSMVKLQQRVYEPIAMGEYPATVTAITSTEGQFGPELQFDFTLADTAQTRIRAWAGATLSPKSKLGRWVQAILGKLPRELDTDELIGKRCIVAVLNKVRSTDGTTYNRIDDIRRFTNSPAGIGR